MDVVSGLVRSRGFWQKQDMPRSSALIACSARNALGVAITPSTSTSTVAPEDKKVDVGALALTRLI
jgi:hypothetical protein